MMVKQQNWTSYLKIEQLQLLYIKTPIVVIYVQFLKTK